MYVTGVVQFYPCPSYSNVINIQMRSLEITGHLYGPCTVHIQRPLWVQVFWAEIMTRDPKS